WHLRLPQGRPRACQDDRRGEDGDRGPELQLDGAFNGTFHVSPMPDLERPAILMRAVDAALTQSAVVGKKQKAVTPRSVRTTGDSVMACAWRARGRKRPPSSGSSCLSPRCRCIASTTATPGGTSPAA